MRLEVGLLGLSQSRLSSSERLRASLAPYRPEAPVPGWLRNRSIVERVDQLERTVLRLTPKVKTRPVDVIYLHGGAYVSPMRPLHWWIVAQLMRATGARVTVPQWAGDRSTADPMISPLNDHLGDLPPLMIAQGGRDIFWPDAHRLADTARTAGGEVRLIEAPDGFHVYVAALWTPEARQAFAAVSQTVAGLR